MKTTAILFAAMCAAAALTGCKNDNEQDYLDYLQSLEKPSDPSNGGDNTEPGEALAGALVLNELDGNAKFIELYNAGDTEVDISGCELHKDESKTIYVAPAGTKIAPKAFLVLIGNAADYSAGFTSGLSADKATRIDLYNPDGKIIDTFCNPPADPSETWQAAGKYSGKSGKRSFSRCPDGKGKWALAASTPGEPNAEAETLIEMQ